MATVHATMPSLRAAQERFARYYLALAEQAEPQLVGAEQEAWLERLELEHDNVRAVLRWAQEGGGQQIGLQLAGAVWRFWSVRGYLSEGRTWLEELLGPVEAQTTSIQAATVRAKALNGAGHLAYQRSDYTQATALHEESLLLCRELGDKRGIANALYSLGLVAQELGHYAQATALHEESLALRREVDDTRGIANGLSGLGIVVQEQGDYARAAKLHEESLILLRELGDKRNIANSLNILGIVTQYQCDYTRATALYEESLALAQELGDAQSLHFSYQNLGNVAYDQAEYARATVLYEKSLALAREYGDQRGIAVSLNNLGHVARAQGDYVRAIVLHQESLALRLEVGDTRGIAYCLEGLASTAGVPGGDCATLARAGRLFGAAATLRSAIGAPLPPNERAAYDRIVATARMALGEATFAAAWAEGQRMTLEQALALALDEPSPT